MSYPPRTLCLLRVMVSKLVPSLANSHLLLIRLLLTILVAVATKQPYLMHPNEDQLHLE